MAPSKVFVTNDAENGISIDSIRGSSPVNWELKESTGTYLLQTRSVLVTRTSYKVMPEVVDISKPSMYSKTYTVSHPVVIDATGKVVTAPATSNTYGPDWMYSAQDMEFYIALGAYKCEYSWYNSSSTISATSISGGSRSGYDTLVENNAATRSPAKAIGQSIVADTDYMNWAINYKGWDTREDYHVSSNVISALAKIHNKSISWSGHFDSNGTVCADGVQQTQDMQ